VYSAVLKNKFKRSNHQLSPNNINPNEASRNRNGTVVKYQIEGIFAAKIISQFQIKKDGPEIAERRNLALRQEIFLMNEIDSPHVIKVHEFFSTNEKHFII
jgi:hypothetical protein